MTHNMYLQFQISTTPSHVHDVKWCHPLIKNDTVLCVFRSEDVPQNSAQNCLASFRSILSPIHSYLHQVNICGDVMALCKHVTKRKEKWGWRSNHKTSGSNRDTYNLLIVNMIFTHNISIPTHKIRIKDPLKMNNVKVIYSTLIGPFSKNTNGAPIQFLVAST